MDPSRDFPVPPRHIGHQVRGERALVAADTLLMRADGWLARWVPEYLNPLAQAGRTANLALLVAVVSGILLLFWYSPSIQSAHDSLAAIQGRTLGGWVRALHRYASDLLMLLLLVHAARTFFARKFTGGRWLPWVSGIVLLGIVWFIGWTGYWLVWDQPAQITALSLVRLADFLPVFGEPMSRLFVADHLIPSLLFFVIFFLHMLVPLLIAVGLVFHLARLSRVRLLPHRALSWGLLIALGVASWLWPAPLDPPARMGVVPESLTVNAWYLAPVLLSLRLGDPALWGILIGATGLAVGIPWILGRRPVPASDPASIGRRQTTGQTVVDPDRCHACTQCVQDCPFGAVTMLPRVDPGPLDSVAWVDPSRCVGCAVCVGSCDSMAMDLPDFRAELLESGLVATTRRLVQSGGEVTVALVAADIDGGMAHFRATAWLELLPGYTVQAVPTASWVRPRLVERLLKAGASGVLIIREKRAEAQARDGGLWVEQRLLASRKPRFRPKLAGDYPQRWSVVDFDASRPAQLRSQAKRFRLHQDAPADAHSGHTAPLRSVMGSVLLLAAVIALAVFPSHCQVNNPIPSTPHFVFSFRAFGEPEAVGVIDPELEARRPVHMRGRPTAKPRRHEVKVRLLHQGRLLERSFAPKGVSRDGPAIGEWRLPLTAGPTHLQVELALSPESAPLVWEQRFLARERHLHVLLYDPAEGFLWLEDPDHHTPQVAGAAPKTHR